jgi:hypothetical protein
MRSSRRCAAFGKCLERNDYGILCFTIPQAWMCLWRHRWGITMGSVGSTSVLHWLHAIAVV